MARARNSTIAERPEPGDLIYFYWGQKYQGRSAKRILALKSWHGPALLVAWESNVNAFVSYKGQLVKCAAEHIRRMIVCKMPAEVLDLPPQGLLWSHLDLVGFAPG